MCLRNAVQGLEAHGPGLSNANLRQCNCEIASASKCAEPDADELPSLTQQVVTKVRLWAVRLYASPNILSSSEFPRPANIPPLAQMHSSQGTSL
jgi:hypothetical protein